MYANHPSILRNLVSTQDFVAVTVRRWSLVAVNNYSFIGTYLNKIVFVKACQHIGGAVLGAV